jgi:hypothetical protein
MVILMEVIRRALTTKFNLIKRKQKIKIEMYSLTSAKPVPETFRSLHVSQAQAKYAALARSMA